MSSNSKKYFILVIIFIVGITIYKFQFNKSVIAKIGNTKIFVEIVRTPAQLSKGLSGRASLGPNRGMLFMMPGSDKYSFWMKDMLFPIDIIWISNNTVIAIDRNVPIEPSSTNSKLYSPPEKIQKVIEVNAGFVEKHRIKVGDIVSLPK